MVIFGSPVPVSARRLGEQALATFRELGDRPGTIAALNNLAITAFAQLDGDASLAFGLEVLAMTEQSGDQRTIGTALNNTAVTLRSLDRLDEAGPLFERALKTFRRSAEVDDALGRVDAATYGVCERCGRPIAAERLAVGRSPAPAWPAPNPSCPPTSSRHRIRR
jgi:hypothetical protein